MHRWLPPWGRAPRTMRAGGAFRCFQPLLGYILSPGSGVKRARGARSDLRAGTRSTVPSPRLPSPPHQPGGGGGPASRPPPPPERLRTPAPSPAAEGDPPGSPTAAAAPGPARRAGGADVYWQGRLEAPRARRRQPPASPFPPRLSPRQPLLGGGVGGGAGPGPGAGGRRPRGDRQV